MNNKRLAINMIATLFSFCVTMGINFVLSPYIINTLGKEAYGFVGLANNCISYVQLVTLALNSMAGRFITIKIHQNDKEGANKYFTSVVIANIMTAITLMIPTFAIVLNLNRIINVPESILGDIQILWGLVFLNFLIGLVLTTFNVATFVTNRLDLSSIRDIQSNFIRLFVLITAFLFFTPSVWYIGFASVICTIFVGLYNIYYKHKLLPDVKVKTKYFDIKVIFELLKSGFWNVVIKLGQILTDGLDLLISNIFINPSAMGLLAIAKTIPNAIASLLGVVTSVFTPQLTMYYAKNDKESLVNELTKSMRFCGSLVNIPLVFLFVYGINFYSLWTPTENFTIINILSLLTISSALVQGLVNPLFNVFTITNRLKFHASIILLNGFLNAILVIIILKTTTLGIFAIAGVSSIIAILRDLFYTPIYSAQCLSISKKTFYPVILRFIISSAILIILFNILKLLILNEGWISLILNALICGIIGLIINFLVILSQEEKKIIKTIIFRLCFKRIFILNKHHDYFT